MTNIQTSVCIVGGGPAGLLLALLLAKRGVDVIVLEGHGTFEREVRDKVLQPSTAHWPSKTSRTKKLDHRVSIKRSARKMALWHC
jgi:2-polyprenyl-6-methoxyphenol hydroxylase-like FAD-dependent oxidoreductase